MIKLNASEWRLNAICVDIQMYTFYGAIIVIGDTAMIWWCGEGRCRCDGVYIYFVLCLVFEGVDVRCVKGGYGGTQSGLCVNADFE